MPGDVLGIDPFLLTVAGMALATLATRWLGLWLVSQTDLSPRLEAGLEAIPGAVLVSLIVPSVVSGGPAEWGAAIVVVALAYRTGSLLVSMVGGMAVVVALRAILG